MMKIANLALLVYSLERSNLIAASPLDDDSQLLRRLQSDAFTSCLRDIAGDHVIVVPGNKSFIDASNCHNSGRSDRTWSPRAVIKVTTVEQVAAAVVCAKSAEITVTPRSGAHGFENEACSGELIVDMSNLDSFEVDTNTKVVQFGSGHLHGQLYRKLIDYELVVPGGTENSVGTAGLWLGCGRGLMSQMYGLSCDNLLGIEYVDANGTIRVADSSNDLDMFWMARGSGGEFPGIVTKFNAQAYDMPSEVYIVKTYFEIEQTKELIRAWVERIDDLSEPSNSMMAYIKMNTGKLPQLVMTCFSCKKKQKDYLMTQFEDITALSGGSNGDFEEWTGTWLDRLLREDWDAYETESDLLQQPEWPEIWNTMANGAHMVPNTEASEGMLNAIQTAIEDYSGRISLYLYSMSGSQISSVPLNETAYGGREAKYVVHYKVDRYTTNAAEVKLPLRDLSRALDQSGLPCKGFYNYADREFPCAAGSGDRWLEAHFSDVPRMKAIKEARDPDGRFMSTLKAKKWTAP